MKVGSGDGPAGGGVLSPSFSSSAVDEFRALVTDEPLVTEDQAMLAELRALEELKGAAEARQARLTAAYDTSVRAQAAARGIPNDRRSRGVAEAVALARRVSPHRGRQLLGLAKVVHNELPHTAAAFDRGLLSEWRVTLVARETACLELADRLTVDATLAGDPASLESLGDRALADAARAMAIELDSASVARRAKRAESERCVTVRPAPDSMVYLTALVPMAQGVAAYATLKRLADSAVATGQATSRGQVMADALVQAILLAGSAPGSAPGSTSSGAGFGPSAPTWSEADSLAASSSGTGVSALLGKPHPPVTVDLLIDVDSLVGAGESPAWIDGGGVLPAATARRLVLETLEAGQQVELRRLFGRPETRELVAMESRRRQFPPELAELIRLRDRTCRTPFCDAPIAHIDHRRPASRGGPTSAENGKGLCAQCNIAKEAREE